MTDTTTPAELADRMKAAWQERHDETLTDAEAAYCVREHVDPGFMDFGSLTVLHALRAGLDATGEGRDHAAADQAHRDDLARDVARLWAPFDWRNSNVIPSNLIAALDRLAAEYGEKP